MSMRALNWAKLQKTGQPAAKCVLLLLADHSRPVRAPGSAGGALREGCFPGADLLACEAEVSERYVRDMLKTLAGLGLVEVVPRYRDGRRTTNLYLLAVPEDFEPARERPVQGNRSHTSGSTGATGTIVPPGMPPESLSPDSEAGPTGTMVPQQPEPWFLAEPEVEPEEPPPPTPSTPGAGSAPRDEERGAEGEGGAAEEEPEEHPDARTVLSDLHLNRTPGGRERREALGLISAALHLGWPADKLTKVLDRDWTGVRDRVRTLISHRAQPDELGPAPQPDPPRATTTWDDKPATDPSDQKPTPTGQAGSFLRALPAPWACPHGVATAHLAEQLATAVARHGRTLDGALAARLTADGGGITDHQAALRARVAAEIERWGA